MEVIIAFGMAKMSLEAGEAENKFLVLGLAALRAAEFIGSNLSNLPEDVKTLEEQNQALLNSRKLAKELADKVGDKRVDEGYGWGGGPKPVHRE